MKCPDKAKILAYLDNELHKTEYEITKEHISTCESCQDAFNTILDNKSMIKEAIDLLEPDEVIVPEFKFEEVTKASNNVNLYEMPSIKQKIASSMKILVPSAAAVLLFLCVKSSNLLNTGANQEYLEAVIRTEHEMMDSNPNAWMNDREISFSIVDKEEKTIERITSTKKSDKLTSEIIKY